MRLKGLLLEAHLSFLQVREVIADPHSEGIIGIEINGLKVPTQRKTGIG